MTDDFQGCILVAQTELMVAKQMLNDEIGQYPTPIAGCDVQFNHLLEERQKVLAALDALKAAFFVPTPRSLTPTAGVESR